MTATFTNKPDTSNLDLVRILVNDTTGSLSDETINYFLASEPSVWYAAAMCCDTLASQAGGQTSLTVGDLSIAYSAGEYKTMAKSYRIRGARGAVPFAGGISVSAKDTEKDDTDRVAPAFSIGMHDDPGTTY